MLHNYIYLFFLKKLYKYITILYHILNVKKRSAIFPEKNNNFCHFYLVKNFLHGFFNIIFQLFPRYIPANISGMLFMNKTHMISC